MKKQTQKSRGWLYLIGAMFFLLAACVLSCAGMSPLIGPIVQDVTGAICKELETQPEPEWVIFTCSLIDPSAKVNEGKPQTFEVKIRRSTLTKELQVTK